MPLARSSEVRSKPCRAGEVVCLPGHLPHALLVLAAAPQCLRSHLDRASVVSHFSCLHHPFFPVTHVR